MAFVEKLAGVHGGMVIAGAIGCAVVAVLAGGPQYTWPAIAFLALTNVLVLLFTLYGKTVHTPLPLENSGERR